MFKHTATYQGHIFTRNSMGRHYSHCIIRIHNVAKARAAAEREGREYWVKNLNYTVFVAGLTANTPATYAYPNSGRPWFNKDGWSQKDIDKAKDLLAGGEAAEVARHLAYFDKSMENAKLTADGEHFIRGGDEWCGRPDLADKAIAAHMKHGVRAIALPADVVQHVVKSRKAQ